MPKVDVEATCRAGFEDLESVVLLDGREILAGKDWEKRKKQLWERCKGQCEYMLESGDSIHMGRGAWVNRLERCRREAHDPHHVTPRSKGRDDRLSNLIFLCKHHFRMVSK